MSFQLNLETETVDHAFPADALCVSADDTIRRVFELLKQHNRGNVIICEDEKLIGIFTERDALRLMASDLDLDTPIGEVMIRDPVSLSPTSTVAEAIALMSTRGYRRLPIVDESNRPQGVLKVSGILHYLVEHFPNVVYTLPPKPHHSTQEREGA